MTKNLLAFVTILALAACNNTADTTPTPEAKVAADAETATTVDDTAATPEDTGKLEDLFEMPFRMAMAPDTRVFGFGIGQYFVGDMHEAHGVLATKASPKDVVDFYEKALEDLGFEIFSKSSDVDKPSLAAKRDDTGDYLTLSAITRSREKYDLEADETGLSILFRMPSLDRNK